MKKYLVILTGILFLFACNNNADVSDDDIKTSNNNALLAKKVEVMDRIVLKNEDNPDWVISFNDKAFFETVFGKVFSGEFTDCYNTPRNSSDTSRYTIEELKQRMMSTSYFNKETKQKETVYIETEAALAQLKEILFKEEWNYNVTENIFEKKINAWIPIRVYHRQDDIEKKDTRYKMIVVFKNDNIEIPKKMIAEDYTYIFDFYHEYNLERVGLDKKGFFKHIINNIEIGKIKTYDPIYLVDKSKREFTIDELKNYAGITLDPEEFANEVYKMIFIEDWYFDEKTFNISKKVKGLGFISSDYKNGLEERILFFIFFE